MIVFTILLFLLTTQIILNGYNYREINVSTDFSGSNNADVSKNLTLGALVLSIVFLVFICILYYFKFINYSRSEFLFVVSISMVGIIMIISYHYLNLQYKSGANYETSKNSLRDASVLINENELDISLIGGIITLALGIAIGILLMGKYLIAETKIVKVREPVYLNMQSSTLKEDYKEPDYMSDMSKNFIV